MFTLAKYFQGTTGGVPPRRNLRNQVNPQSSHALLVFGWRLCLMNTLEFLSLSPKQPTPDVFVGILVPMA